MVKEKKKKKVNIIRVYLFVFAQMMQFPYV